MSRPLLFFACSLGVSLALPACGPGGQNGDGGHPLAPTAIPDPMHAASTPDDIDGDGVPNATDDCPSVANADQRDACNYDAPPPTPTGAAAADGAAYLSWIRARTGLAAVTEDATLSHGCQVHLQYLQSLSMELGRPMLEHTEDLTKSYASAEGNQAGIDSVLALGNATIAGSIDVWINSLYHRLPLLHPGLARVGVAALGQYGCIQYRPGTTDSVRAPHEIFWPPPDATNADRTFIGSESPCPTVADPLAGGSCPAGGTIATMGIHGWGALSNVTATLTNVATGADTSLLHLYFDGGPSRHEQQGYVEGTVALVPQPMTTLDRGTYLVTVNATVGSTARTFRWRFRTGTPLPTDLPCDPAHHDIAGALAVAGGETPGKICGQPMVYQIGGTGTRTVTLSSDFASGDLDMEQLDASGARQGLSDGQTDTERLSVPAGGYVRVYGFNGAMGAFLLRVQ